MWLVVGLCIVFVVLLDFYRKKSWDRKANIPGPAIYPIFGNLFQYLNHNPETLFEKVRENFEDYKGIYRVWVLNYYAVAVRDPEEIEAIIGSSKNIEKNELYDVLTTWLKEGLILSRRSKWLQRRKILTPAFHFSMFEQFVQIFDEQSNILVNKLRPYALDGDVCDMQNYITLATLDIVSESILGVKINAQLNKESAYVKAIHSLNTILRNRIVKYQINNPLFSILAYPTKRKYDKILHTLHSFTQNIIDERRRALGKEFNTSQSNQDNDISEKKKLTFLDLLLQTSIDGKPLSNDDIREEVDTFTYGGADTTATAICSTLFLISRHPEVQSKVFKEVKNIFGEDRTCPATYNDLQKLKYTEFVIKEALRLYSPVIFIGRKVDQDLRLGDKLLPAGSSVFIVMDLVMKNPKYFPDPEKFIPERHSAENSVETNHFAYIPFSAGPRNCIGQKYAMQEMKSIISKILRNYELLPLGKDLKRKYGLVLQSSTGYQMGLKLRVRQL